MQEEGKEAEMIAALIATLFAAAAFLALAAIGTSWRDYGAAALELRRQLAECTRTREFRYRLVTTTVRGEARPGATIYKVNFRPPAKSLALRLPGRPELRAAA